MEAETVRKKRKILTDTSFKRHPECRMDGLKVLL